MLDARVKSIHATMTEFSDNIRQSAERTPARTPAEDRSSGGESVPRGARRALFSPSSDRKTTTSVPLENRIPFNSDLEIVEFFSKQSNFEALAQYLEERIVFDPDTYHKELCAALVTPNYRSKHYWRPRSGK